MIYCTRCIYPNTKPDLTFDDSGLCSACQSYDTRALIDWDARALDFKKVISDAKYADASYDCIVPVSGGKDSHYQVLTALDHGLKVLAVTAETDMLSEIGKYNLDNISKLGCDHIIVKNDPIIRRKINRYTLETIGDISWAEHITIFTIPVRIALMMNIPLIIWGENPQNEYGGPTNSQKATELTEEWLNEFGGLNGLRVTDIEVEISLKNSLYQYPELSTNPPKGIFLGQFFKWDGLVNAKYAMLHGFKVPNQHHVEGSYGNYENLDNYQTGIHDYFKYIKFGFGRATDILCNHIRRGMISREEAFKITKERDGMFPSFYLGLPLKDILTNIDMSIIEFLEICDQFTNWDLFEGSHAKAGYVKLKTDLLEVNDDRAD